MKRIIKSVLICFFVINANGSAGSNEDYPTLSGTITNWPKNELANIRITVGNKQTFVGPIALINGDGEFLGLSYPQIPDEFLTLVAIPACDNGSVKVSSSTAKVGTALLEVLNQETNDPIGFIEESSRLAYDSATLLSVGDKIFYTLWSNQDVSFRGMCSYRSSLVTQEYNVNFLKGWNLVSQEITSKIGTQITGVKLALEARSDNIRMFFKSKK
jgi:hypothetical protein